MSIDLESYLTEIDPDQVCGEDLEYDPEFIALEQELAGKEEQSMGDSVIEAEPPNWREVKKMVESLLKRTRDLRLCVYYIKALSQLNGFEGFADGIVLLKSTTERFWEHVYPQLDPDDDNDPTERINILMTLCDFETFLRALQKLPVVESKTVGKFSLLDIHLAKGVIQGHEDEEQNLPSMTLIEGAFQDTDPDQVLAKQSAIQQSIQDIIDLESFVTDQVGVSNAPSFDKLRSLLKEIEHEMAQQVSRLGLGEENQDESESEYDEASDDGALPSKGVRKSGASAPVGINNTQDVIKSLNLIVEYYKNNEPSSPIPILLERVKRLIGKDFMEIMRDIAPNGVEQIEFLGGLSDNDE